MKINLPRIDEFNKKSIRKIINYFLQGLLYIGPFFAVFYVIYWIFLFIDGILPFNIPGLGFIVIIVGLTFIGYFGNTVISQPLFKYIRKTINRMPLVKTIYESVTDLLSAFIGNKKKFTVPVMVKINVDAEIYKLGFLTKEDVSELGFEKRFVAVFLPHSYNFSGNLFVVPSALVKPINMSSSEVMKFITSGGVINYDEIKKENAEEDMK